MKRLIAVLGVMVLLCAGVAFYGCAEGDGEENVIILDDGVVISDGEEPENCSNECTTSGDKQCSGNVCQTCSDYDDDECLEWGTVSNEIESTPSASDFLLPDTGQITCYDNSALITCPSPGGAFYGQDACYDINPMNFTDNGDGTVSDNLTGLVWEQMTILRSLYIFTWQEAIDYCDALTLAGHNDWYLPDEYELQSIMDYEVYNRAIDTDYFPNTQSFHYWSSSTYTGRAGYAWYVNFEYGYVDLTSKTYYQHARCVRGSNPYEQSFTDNGDNTVTESLTGLMWEQKTTTNSSYIYTWEEALNYCESLELAGHDDWRLPNIKELKSLVDNTVYSPAIDTNYFPNTQSIFYWSSSTYAYYTGFAWYVRSSTGDVDYGFKIDDLFASARCVR